MQWLKDKWYWLLGIAGALLGLFLLRGSKEATQDEAREMHEALDREQKEQSIADEKEAIDKVEAQQKVVQDLVKTKPGRENNATIDDAIDRWKS